MNTMWSGIWVVTIVAFAIGHFANCRTRRISVIALMLSPIAVVTIGLAAVPPAAPSYLLEWPRAMWLILPWLAVWMGLAAIGYVGARWSVR